MATSSGKSKGKQTYRPSREDPENVDWEIVQQTMNDNGNYKIAEGSFGPVYAGSFKGQNAAIKIGDLSLRPDKMLQFKGERDLLIKFKDEPRFIKLLGYGEVHTTEGEKANEKVKAKVYLIYKRMPGTVEDGMEELDWNTTLEILTDTAEGLAVLHKENLVHCDIKPQNLLLDEKHKVKLGDFGGVKKQGERRLVDTPGYITNEASSNGIAYLADDVFAFGVTLLQLIMKEENVGNFPNLPKKAKHGQKPRKQKANDDEHIIEKANHLVSKGDVQHAVTSELLNTSGCTVEKAKKITNLALCCCDEQASKRPNISKIIQDLGELK